MSGMIITEQKKEQLRRRMEALGLFDADLEEQFVRGAGKGGQKINKTSSCVVLIHKPSGITVKCQQGRSQAANRFFARRELCERIEEKREDVKSKRQQRAEKIRRQKRRRSRRQKERMLDEKAQQGAKKQNRKKIQISRDMHD